MKKSVQIGANKTGLGLAPKMAEELFDGADDQFKSFAQADEDIRPDISFADVKHDYTRSSGPVGTVPAPSSIKGAAVTGFQKITARHPEVFIDKLGERLAFERTGTRLYDAFIMKCETQLPEASIAFLRQIREEEMQHFLMLTETLKELGADPTAMTPCADVAAVASKGLIAVVNDPRTSIAQAAGAVLSAELIDNDGWDLLIELAANARMEDLRERFEAAKASEVRHLSEIREWLKELVLANDVIQYQ